MSFLVDTNLLLYAAFEGAPEHRRARGWLEHRFEDLDGFVGLSWLALFAFARLASDRRVMGPAALAVPAAWAAIEAYLQQPTARLVEPGASHRSIASRLVKTPGLSSDDTPDVYLAALAIEHGLTLATHDHGFGRFANLTWEDPLLSGTS
ncbi:MAG: TA system VapC family ribonuclease toxin [Actinomycetota bacterium]